jgi:hypothetical protein
MKSISFYLIVFVVLFSACEDYLDTEQVTRVTEGNYFNTPAEAERALVGCYDGLQIIWEFGVALPVASAVAGDLTFGSTGAADNDGYPMMDEFDVNRSPANRNLFEGNWTNYYRAVFRCNSLIGKLDQVDWASDPTARNRIESEARFIRAYLYFDMVRMWERIPLLTEPSAENIPQSEPDDTYRVIVEDLLFATENGSNTPYAGISGDAHGHAHIWAAKSLLARVYLYYTGYYGQSDLLGLVSQSDALSHLEDVIADGGFSLVDNYFDLWPAAATYDAAQRGDSISANTYVGENNPETIFAIKYTYTSTWGPDANIDGNHWMVMNGLRNQAWGEYGYGNGWGACSVVPEFYQNWNPADDRRAASIMAIDEEGIDFNQIDDVKEYTGYFTKKYIPTADSEGNSVAQDVLGGVSFMISQFQDYVSIRYADVLLMAAELGSPNAVNYVNMVRARAGVAPVAAVDKDVIFEERKYELAFEGHRYWDLLRYDNTLAYAASQVNYDGTVRDGGVVIPKKIDGANLIATRGLFQIPNSEITLSNGVLTQNPGWE